MNEKKSTRKGKCFLKSLKNKIIKKTGTQTGETESNISSEEVNNSSGLRMFIFIASCAVIIVCCILLLKWNYSSPGVTVKTENDTLNLDNKDHIAEESSDVLININTADKEQLMTLPGIGETLAIRITEYRDEHGKFNAVEDIMLVDGIGQKKYNDIAELITVDTEDSNEDTGS